MDNATKLTEEIRKFVEEHDIRVMMDEPVCLEHKAGHPNCLGCIGHLGCSKYNKMLTIAILPMMYQPKDFQDFVTMTNRMMELKTKTMEARTIEELKALPTI